MSFFCLGISNFLYSLLCGEKGFAVTSMSFSGFLFVSLLYKVGEVLLMSKNERYQQSSLGKFFHYMRDPVIFGHVMIRTLNYCFYIYLLLVIGDYAQRAQINVGIILSILPVEIVYVTIYGYLFFDERLGWKMIIGIVVIMGGISWITLSKPVYDSTSIPSPETESDRAYYRLFAVFLTISLPLL